MQVISCIFCIHQLESKLPGDPVPQDFHLALSKAYMLMFQATFDSLLLVCEDFLVFHAGIDENRSPCSG